MANPYHQIVELLRRVEDSKSSHGRDQDLRRASFKTKDVVEIRLVDDILQFQLKDGRIWTGNPDDLRWAEIFPLLEAAEIRAVQADLGYGSRSVMGAEMLIELGRRVKKTIPLEKADRIAEKIMQFVKPYTETAMIAGSIRRRRPEIGDVELVVLPKDLESFLDFLDSEGWVGGDRIRKKMVSGIPVELYLAHKPEELGAMLFMYTGDWQHNIAMRAIAKRQGWKLDQYGIWDAKTGKLLFQSPDEREFYDYLGVDWHDPEDRSFKDRPKGKRSKSMGAEMLIELGASERKVGYINLKVIPPEEDGGENWILQVERIDPYGGEPWLGEFPFQSEEDAMGWFKMVQGDEDIDHLISIFTRR